MFFILDIKYASDGYLCNRQMTATEATNYKEEMT